MYDSTKKCVMVIDHEQPLGVMANTAAILGCTLGKNFGEVIGNSIEDGNGFLHKPELFTACRFSGFCPPECRQSDFTWFFGWKSAFEDQFLNIHVNRGRFETDLPC